MSLIKVTPADRWFSKCVRERADWHCERCGSAHAHSSTGLHCSHYIGRSIKATRLYADNCSSLCWGCHRYMGAHPEEHRARVKLALGEERFEALRLRPIGFKWRKRMWADAKVHYKAEYAKLLARRALGETGRLEFEGWMPA